MDTYRVTGCANQQQLEVSKLLSGVDEDRGRGSVFRGGVFCEMEGTRHLENLAFSQVGMPRVQEQATERERQDETERFYRWNHER